jgi:hypothetical protein
MSNKPKWAKSNSYCKANTQPYGTIIYPETIKKLPWWRRLLKKLFHWS